MKQLFLALGGALAGGILGYFAFFWTATQGFYALVLPGGLLGLGAGIVINRSILVALSCGLLATALGLFTEWRFAPFTNDASFVNFLANVHHLKPVTLVMILLGGLIGFWVPYHRMESSTTQTTKRPEDLKEPPSKHPV
jgi:quinol-cytochrome oxidoreductase complex cytochrome b subunit